MSDTAPCSFRKFPAVEGIGCGTTTVASVRTTIAPVSGSWIFRIALCGPYELTAIFTGNATDSFNGSVMEVADLKVPSFPVQLIL